MRYLVSRHFHEVSQEDQMTENDEILELLTFEEAETIADTLQYHRILLRNLREEVSCCKAEMLPEAIVGTLLIPDKSAPLSSAISLIFYFQKSRLIIIDEKKQLDDTKARLLAESLMTVDNLYRFFFEILESFIDGDMFFLQNYEKRLNTMEDSLAEVLPRQLKSNVITCRRELLKYHAYYQQLMDMFEIFAKNINSFFPCEYPAQFQRLLSRVDRLYDCTEVLREYACQIREMHQSLIDLRQNDTMRILTVVSTLFFPLSLITGWYGMNFRNMPELQQPFAYFILIILCSIIVVGEIWFFKKKGWL